MRDFFDIHIDLVTVPNMRADEHLDSTPLRVVIHNISGSLAYTVSSMASRVPGGAMWIGSVSEAVKGLGQGDVIAVGHESRLARNGRRRYRGRMLLSTEPDRD